MGEKLQLLTLPPDCLCGFRQPGLLSQMKGWSETRGFQELRAAGRLQGRQGGA